MLTHLNFTRAKQFKEVSESMEVRSALAHRLTAVKINMFLLDPVPGGSFRGFSLIAWRDDRFYEKTPCTSAEILIARDERTRCFKAIIPKGLSPTLMPGHHGTLSGNLYSQESIEVPSDIEHRNIASLQYLVIGKFLNFINKNTGLFNGRVEPIVLQHLDLDKITNAFLNVEQIQRSKQLLELYQQVHLNDKGFRHFANSSYAMLRGEESTSRSRLVHYGAHNSLGLDTVIPELEGEFVNSDHALLYLHDQMSFSLDSDEDGPDVLITKFSSVLMSIFKRYTSENDVKIKALLNKDLDRRATFQALSIFIDTISQKYLRNHLTVKIKTRLLSELDQTFKVLDSFKKPGEKVPINQIITECENILRAGIKNTANIHLRALKDQTTVLNKQLKSFLISND